ncbi:hypothetical protein [Streptomyces sp. NPDC059788]|uniref:hypothetical protein n=1 Tax=Streptomyces sp. NPDC059788 TaxID=3346948 RepID=UPI0036634E83
MTCPEMHPALVRWGYVEPCPGLRAPAKWETARLAVQAGDYLAQHTNRPTPSENPPAHKGGSPAPSPLVAYGWVRARGWRRIVPAHGQQSLAAMDPATVARRITAASQSALPAALRGLVDRTVRILRHDLADLPDGVALTLSQVTLPDEWWAYLSSGWLSTLTGAPGHSIMLPLPPVHQDPYDRYLADAMRWLDDEDRVDLDPVKEAFAARTPVAPALVVEAMAALRYDTPGIHDRPTRTALARLLSLYSTGLCSDDQELIDLNAFLGRTRDTISASGVRPSSD